MALKDKALGKAPDSSKTEKDTTCFQVAIGCFNNYEEAEVVAKQLQNLGYNAFAVKQ